MRVVAANWRDNSLFGGDLAQHLSISAYRCFVAGVATGSLDIQVRWFEATEIAAVHAMLASDPIHCYENSAGETVTWELVAIFEIEPFTPRESGEEVVGFIASTRELTKLA
jgi:hypothetical protein